MTRHTVPELVTTRLLLRGFRHEDAPAIHAAYGDAEAMRHWNHAPSPDLEQTERYVRGWMLPTPENWMVWAVARQDSDACIGMVNYHNRDIASRRAEIGYILAPGAQRQGYMAEAIGRLISYLQSELEVHRIEAQIEPANSRSCTLVTRLGFVLEAPLLRDRYRVGSEYRSVALYALVGT